ncbi:hypothetical protein [Leptospira interrogans]|uniref:hypothetical protein n=1 Tax=Leptospira interrogans TaxID=173 RepID=UPI000297F7ED|nr:hypothetical protein [Leptospira interrogans]EMN72055.1 hypothetical protein LEP1GSC100_0682 [Leptospira interrogans serovar Bataviae str. UI 08561]EKR83130.1 hypothetical protein LEP1GSC099_4348 [Leptospira interrogans str. UI 08452]EMN33948.1 hypothetical protein LEP1GSC084_1987 [Leptospira interrogans serovar Medanensis str. L0448]EMN40062.1 hypothetical protein LEP1GSC085_0799 [Leptospira interrogans str. L0996]EMN94653.1 hypothetical protein LEP1GSC110_0112 [Leptospira interrogans sero
MKVFIPVEFKYIEPKIPEDVIDNTTLLISFILQARSAFISAMDVWYDKNYPLKDADIKEEFQQGVLDILKNPDFYEKEVTQAAIDFKAEETKSEFSK